VPEIKLGLEEGPGDEVGVIFVPLFVVLESIPLLSAEILVEGEVLTLGIIEGDFVLAPTSSVVLSTLFIDKEKELSIELGPGVESKLGT